MSFKKMFLMLLIASFVFGGAAAYAAAGGTDNTGAPAIYEEKVPISLQYTGSVAEIIKDSGFISALIITEGNDESTARRFNISDYTVVIDNESGTAESLSAIKVGDQVSVIASPMSTFSIPPQSPAYVILTNIQNKAPAKLLQTGPISRKADGTMTILDTENNYLVSITKDTILAPYRTKQIVFPEDIREGDYILVWSEIMTLSIPAQMTADMAVLLTAYDFGKIPMLPVRSIAEGMGFEVKWISESQTVELKKDSLTFSMKIGSNTYVSKGQDLALNSAPEIINGRTYVPAAFFTEIMGITL